MPEFPLRNASEVATPTADAGVVLGSQDAAPLDFWIGIHDEQLVQLDDLVVVTTPIPGGGNVTFYGIVDLVRKRYEGAEFDTDAFRAAEAYSRCKCPMPPTCRPRASSRRSSCRPSPGLRSV